MSYTAETLQLLAPDGTLRYSDETERFRDRVDALDETTLREFYRHMAVTRRFDIEAGNLQRQGQLALWIPSIGQEAAQVGSGFAARAHDHIFPAYREHAVGRLRGLDLTRIIAMLRGLTHGGWNPADTGNFHLYTLVIGSQALHATGYAMGVRFDGLVGTGDPERDTAVLVYFGDGATSQGDVNEAYVFAQSYQTPQVLFLQNNHWAISVPVSVQSRTPLFRRPAGFGIPSVQIDGNDVLVSYAATAESLDAARSGEGPRFIEALTYRMGAHTTSDDPTKYRTNDEVAYWQERDPISRYETFLTARGVDAAFFEEVRQEGEDLAADARRQTLAMEPPPADSMFRHVYSDEHPLMAEQAEWLARYEASFEEQA